MSLGSPERESEVSRLSFRCSSVNSAQSATVSSVSWFLRHPAGRGCRARRHAGGQSGFVYVSVFQLGNTDKSRSVRAVRCRYNTVISGVLLRFSSDIPVPYRRRSVSWPSWFESEGGYRILAEVQARRFVSPSIGAASVTRWNFRLRVSSAVKYCSPSRLFTVLASVASSA